MDLTFPLRSEAFLTVGDVRWYSAIQENALYREDLRTGVVRFMGTFLENGQFRLHGGILCVDDVLYFAPMKADGLDIYDIRQKKFSRIPFEGDAGTPPCGCRRILQIGGCLYFVDGCKRYRVYRYSLQQKTLKAIDQEPCAQSASSCIGMDVSVDDGRLLFCDQERKMAVWFDPQTETFRAEAIPTRNCKLLTIRRVQDALWFSGNRYFCRFDLRTRRTEDLDIFPSGFGNFKLGEHGETLLEQDLDRLSEHPFDESIVCGDKILFVPRKANMAVVLDTAAGKTWGIDIPPETAQTLDLKNGRPTHSRFIGAERLAGGGIRMFSTQEGAFWELKADLTGFRAPETYGFWQMDFREKGNGRICYETPNGFRIAAPSAEEHLLEDVGERIYATVVKEKG